MFISPDETIVGGKDFLSLRKKCDFHDIHPFLLAKSTTRDWYVLKPVSLLAKRYYCREHLGMLPS